MYDRAETAADNDALWAAVARRLNAAPPALTRGAAPETAWTDPALVLSQTCGMPFALWVHNHARYVASPDFQLPDTPAGFYHSVIIARADDPRPAADVLRARPIINQPHSQSGYNALWTYARACGTGLAPVTVSGGHRDSARAVADGRADIAAIDANTWRMLARWDPFAASLRVLARTPPTPAMPFICGPGQDPCRIRDALSRAIADLAPDARARLGLFGLKNLPPASYLAVPLPPNAQIAHAT